MLGPKGDRSAVSEIVGALMLVLIVVIAASSFAVFLSQKQNETQKQQLIDLEKSLERVEVTSFAGENSGDDWLSFNFTISNLYSEDVTITRLAINDHAAAGYVVTREDMYGGGFYTKTMTDVDELTLAGREVIRMLVNVTASNTSLYMPTTFSIKDYLKVDISTERGNIFSRVFIPPSAVGQIVTQTQWNGTDYVPYLILDGTRSAADSGSYIVSWDWNITAVNDTGVHENIDELGSMTRCDFLVNGTTHHIVLTVTDRYGMIDQCEFSYYY
jgi:flagellin-like protein